MREPKTWTNPEPWTRYIVILWKAKTGPGETLPKCYKTLAAATFSPEIMPVAVWEQGKGYTRDKSRTQMELINLQNAASIPGISWGELWEIQNRAENVARRAGLLTEARENGIC